MRHWLVFAAWGSVLFGCAGENMLDGSSTPDPADEIVCYGDPDTDMLCRSRGEFWDCMAMPNGELKCTSQEFPTPDGEAGWTCSAEGESIVCVKDSPDITGISGWTCVSNGKTTTCTTTKPMTPPGGTGWTCSYVDEFGLVCTGTPTESGGSGSGTGTGGSGSGTGGSGSGTGGSGSGTGTGTGGSGGGTTGEGFPCSYAMVVFTYGGKTYVMKVPQGWTTCTFTNQTSSDANFTYSCNGNEYSNPDFIFSSNGSPVPTYGGPESCGDLFTVSGREVWAKAGVTILYAAAHNGSFENHFVSLCPPASGVTHMSFPISCGGAR